MKAIGAALAAVRPAGAAENAWKQLCRDIISDIRDTDQRLITQVAATVGEHARTLTAGDGIGPVIAARLVGRTRNASRFPTASAFANYAGWHPEKGPAPIIPVTGVFSS